MSISSTSTTSSQVDTEVGIGVSTEVSIDMSTETSTGLSAGVTNTNASVLSRFLQWFRGARPICDDNLLEGWLWILSTAEEMSLKHSQQIKAELEVLQRMTGSVRLRPAILSQTCTYYSDLDDFDKRVLVDSRLDASKRHRILVDAIATTAKSWLDVVMVMAYQQRMYQEFVALQHGHNITYTPTVDNIRGLVHRWYSKEYAKNVSGELVALSFQASASAESNGLTCKVLTDILWSMYMCLSKEATTLLGRSLNNCEIAILIDAVITVRAFIVDRWIKITTLVGNICQREGRLPARWTLEHAAEEEKLAAIKERGADAAFKSGTADTFLQKIQRTQLSRRSRDQGQGQGQVKVIGTATGGAKVIGNDTLGGAKMTALAAALEKALSRALDTHEYEADHLVDLGDFNNRRAQLMVNLTMRRPA